jgi:DNA-directed RNA polymerase specialized sigma24 family protein
VIPSALLDLVYLVATGMEISVEQAAELRELANSHAGLRRPERAAHEGISTEQVLALIGALPRDQAEAVLLRVVVGLDGPAAARVLGKWPGAVRSATHRGLKKLAARLTQG